MQNIKLLFDYIIQNHRSTSVVLIFLALLSVFVEMIGLGLIIPASKLIFDVETFLNYPFIKNYQFLFNDVSEEFLITSFIVFFVCVYFFKFFYIIFFTYLQHNFIYDVTSKLSNKLYNIYIHQPYKFHINTNSSILIRNMITEVDRFAASLYYLIILITEILLVIGISFLVISFLEPKIIFFLILIILSGMLLLYRFTRPLLTKWGEERQYSEGQRINKLQQSLQGIKDVKISNTEDEVLEGVKLHSNNLFHVRKKQKIIDHIPRLLIELLTIIAIVAILVFILGDRNSEEVLTLLVVIGAASYKLMPSLNKIFTNIQFLRFSSVSIKSILQDLELKAKNMTINNKEKISFKKEISFSNISFKHEKGDSFMLEKVNCSIPKGSKTFVIGKTGSGKSTFIDILFGLLNPTKGEIFIDDKKLDHSNSSWKNMVAYVPQEIYLNDDSIEKNIRLVNEKKVDHYLMQSCLKDAELNNFIETLPNKINTRIGERGVKLSGGQRQRIGLARAIYKNSDILILDESTTGLDVNTEKKIYNNLFSKEKLTLIIITHKVSNIGPDDNVIILENGRIKFKGRYQKYLQDLKKNNN